MVLATLPAKESGPLSLSMEANIPSEALPEKGRVIASGITSEGIFKNVSTGFKTCVIRSKPPEALKSPDRKYKGHHIRHDLEGNRKTLLGAFDKAFIYACFFDEPVNDDKQYEKRQQ